MNNYETDIVGKIVKDMYGTFMGKAIGTITDIDGSIQTIGVDCGLDGLKQIQFEQLVMQGDSIIFIPRWRLDSQRLIREKGLTLRRLKAVIDLVSENDEMKDDAKIIHEKYKLKLSTLDEAEKQINIKLNKRLVELDEQSKSLKILLFDAKIQYKSNEINKILFESIQSYITELIEHVIHEETEVTNIKRRISGLSLDDLQNETIKKQVQESAISYLGTTVGESETESRLPEVPNKEPIKQIEAAVYHIKTYSETDDGSSDYKINNFVDD